MVVNIGLNVSGLMEANAAMNLFQDQTATEIVNKSAAVENVVLLVMMCKQKLFPTAIRTITIINLPQTPHVITNFALIDVFRLRGEIEV